jgi:undecaprenyl-phosphate galactose phosphotransferase
MIKRDIWFTPTVVCGSGKNALESALALESNILMGYKVIALLDLNLDESESNSQNSKSIWDYFSNKERTYSVLPYSDATKTQLEKSYSPYFVLALDSDDYIKHRKIVNNLASSHHSMSVIPPLRGLPLLGTEISPIFRHEVLHLRIRNNLENKTARIIKRVFDQIVSGLLLILLSPLFLYLTIRIRMDGGPAYFSQERVGKNGQMFQCYKFRSMQVNAESILQNLLDSDENLSAEWDKDQKLKVDPRITRVGDFLRKTSLDELPQIWNVFKGEMSLVGPRPIRQDEQIKYDDQITYYLETPPGITGLWQISGRNDLEYDTRVDLDTWYVRNWSLGMDIVILIKTFSVVFYRKGAY